MPSKARRRFWRTCRICFRGIRITILLFILLLVGLGIYVNQVGLPDFIKDPLLEKLRARGVDLEFSRLRLRWYRGIVAENVSFGRSDQTDGPQLTMKEVELNLDYKALRKLELSVNSLKLRDGNFLWLLTPTNAPSQTLTVDNIQTDLRLLANDQWELNNFQAQFGGAHVQLSGSLTNASVIRTWTRPPSGKKPSKVSLEQKLHKMLMVMQTIKFASPPDLKVDVHGDAMDLESLRGSIHLTAPSAETPWGNGEEIRGLLKLVASNSNAPPHAEFILRSKNTQTKWGSARDIDLNLVLDRLETQTNQVQAALKLQTIGPETKWAKADAANISMNWIHSFSNAIPESAEGTVLFTNLVAEKLEVGSGRFKGRFSPKTDGAITPSDDWGWWSNIDPYVMEWQLEFKNVNSPELRASNVSCDGSWHSPALKLDRLHAELYGGALDGTAGLDVASRNLIFDIASNFDAHQVDHLLTAKSRKWIRQYTWEKPPDIRANGSVTLPSWTNRAPDWRTEVQPTIRLNGEFKVGPATFRLVPVTSAQSHFFYSNMYWRIPDLVATRPEGIVKLKHEANERTKDYYFRVESTIDATAIRPLLDTNQQRAFEFITFTQPPTLNAEIWGRWYDIDRIGGRGSLSLSNFTFRGQSASHLSTTFNYTNLFLKLTNTIVHRGDETASASQLDVDFVANKIYVTNGFSNTDPMVITRAIGPKIAQAIEPYRFGKPPTGHVNGVIPIKRDVDADLHFDVDGGPFQWSKFNLDRVVGGVHWVGQRVNLTDVLADGYNGRILGDAAFDYAPTNGTDFRFSINVSGVDLHKFISDVHSPTNNLEGKLSGQLKITMANTANDNSWNGHGRVVLRNGLIWDIPIFGMFSPLLNAIIPGLGSSRASFGAAHFGITNSVIHSSDLEVRSPALRMRYEGDVHFDGRINAKVEAEALRDTWLIGKVVSAALSPITKLFTYKVTGTLGKPKSEPLYIPKLLMIPLRPIQTLKELFPTEAESSSPAPPPATGSQTPNSGLSSPR